MLAASTLAQAAAAVMTNGPAFLIPVLHDREGLSLARAGRVLQQWGTGPAGGFLAMVTLMPDRTWVVDEQGELTFGEIDRRTNALARGLQDLGVKEGDAIALMARNHRGFVETTVAAAKLGADLIYLNTAFAGPQLVEIGRAHV